MKSFSRTRNVSRYFPVQKKSSYANTETKHFYTIILNICWCVRMFSCVPGIWMNTLMNDNLFWLNSWAFSMFYFLKCCWLKVQNEGNIYTNLNKCHIKITVKVLSNYWVPYQQMIFLLKPWLTLSGHWLI